MAHTSKFTKFQFFGNVLQKVYFTFLFGGELKCFWPFDLPQMIVTLFIWRHANMNWYSDLANSFAFAKVGGNSEGNEGGKIYKGAGKIILKEIMYEK